MTSRDFLDHYGGSLLQRYHSSFYALFGALYPNKEWLAWRFDAVPRGFWKNMANQKAYLDWLGKKLGYHAVEDFYHLRKSDVVYNYGAGLIDSYYGNSPSALVMAVYRDYPFLPWRFNVVPFGFWDKKENQHAYVEWLRRQVGVGSIADLRFKHFAGNHGEALLKLYHDSPQELITSLQGGDSNAGEEGKHLSYIPRDHWASQENQRKFLQDLALKLGHKHGDLNQWYSVSIKDFSSNGGGGLLGKFGNSTYALLRSAYPEHSWEPWRFTIIPRQALKNAGERQNVVKFVEKELKMKSLDEWYRISLHQLKELGVDRFFIKGGGLFEVLKEVHPMHNWDASLFQSHSRR